MYFKKFFFIIGFIYEGIRGDWSESKWLSLSNMVINVFASFFIYI